MTVKELLTILETLDPEAGVFISDADWFYDTIIPITNIRENTLTDTDYKKSYIIE